MILFSNWALNGSLAVAWPGTIEYNGTQAGSGTLPTGWADVVADPLGGDHSALKITVKPTDSAVVGGARTEIGESSATNVEIADWAGYEDAARWYRAQWLVPDDFDYTLPNPSGAGYKPCLFQVHERNDTSPADDIMAPTFWCLLEEDGAVRIYNSLTSPASDTQTTSSNRWTRHITTVPSSNVGRWVDFLLRVKWGWTASNASMEIWINKRKVFAETGAASQPNTFNNDPARGGGKLYCKLGLYEKWHSDWGSIVGRNRVVYHRGLIIGDENAAFADMYPEEMSAVELSSTFARTMSNRAGMSARYRA